MPTRPLVQGITIDAEVSKDLDDAIWVEPTDERLILHVSISDVSASVRRNTKTDQIGLTRAFTRYGPDFTHTMLPRWLAEDQLSLLPGQERRTITVSVTFKAGDETEVQVRRTKLKSQARLSYGQVAAILGEQIEAPDPEVARQLTLLSALANVLLAKRRANGALAFYDLRRGWSTNEEGLWIKLPRREDTIGQVIVQECMIATNVAVAEWLLAHNAPALFRNHVARVSAPDRSELLSEIEAAVASPVQELQRLFTRIGLVVERASYGPRVQGHYGLNLPAYVHFTSPIRRFPDLVNHRAVVSVLNGNRSPYDMDELAAIAEVVNQVERELKDRTSRAYIEISERDTQRDLERGEFRVLDRDRFFDVLMASCSASSFSPALIEEVEDRIKGDDWGARESFAVLLVANSPEAHHLRWLVILQLIAQPHLAPSVMTMAAQRLGWPVVKYELKRSGPDHALRFTCTAAVDVKGRTFRSPEVTASSQKEAQQQSCLKLLAEISGYVGELPEQERRVTQRGSSNPKGALNELCQARAWDAPTYRNDSVGPTHAQSFTAEATVVVDGTSYSATGEPTGNTKAAEQSAAAKLLQVLQAIPAQADEPVAIAPGHNYVSALQEFCMQKRWSIPEYTYRRSGSDHVPTFACTCTIPGTEFQADGEGPNKKEAKQLAAQRVYSLLS